MRCFSALPSKFTILFVYVLRLILHITIDYSQQKQELHRAISISPILANMILGIENSLIDKFHKSPSGKIYGKQASKHKINPEEVGKAWREIIKVIMAELREKK